VDRPGFAQFLFDAGMGGGAPVTMLSSGGITLLA
jgi:hypothetical protein